MNIKNVYSDKLIVIQFPNKSLKYTDYNEFYDNIIFLKAPDYSYTYRGLPINDHHFTTKFHIENVIPTILSQCDITFNINDFNLISNKHTANGTEFDLSYLKPKEPQKYLVYDYIKSNMNEYPFEELCNFNWSGFPGGSCYHALYRFFHQCSHLHNENSKTAKSIFISGDSQMIPSIMPLAYYFRDIYYFDNRTGESGGDMHDDKVTHFITERLDVDYILISLWDNPDRWYHEVNFC